MNHLTSETIFSNADYLQFQVELRSAVVAELLDATFVNEYFRSGPFGLSHPDTEHRVRCAQFAYFLIDSDSSVPY